MEEPWQTDSEFQTIARYIVRKRDADRLGLGIRRCLRKRWTEHARLQDYLLLTLSGEDFLDRNLAFNVSKRIQTWEILAERGKHPMGDLFTIRG